MSQTTDSTFEQFQATRREVANVGVEIDGGGWDESFPGFVYDIDGACGWIEKLNDGRVSLVLDRSDFCVEADQLPVLEKRLYDWLRAEVARRG